MRRTDLDDIIDRNSSEALASAVPTFRSFTPADWAMYAGCETKDPQIAGTPLLDVVVDGSTVRAILFRDDQESGLLYSRRLMSETVATAIARSIAANEIADEDFMATLLGQPIGEL